MCRGTGLTPHSYGEVELEGRDLTRDASDDAPGQVARIDLGAVDSIGVAPSCAEVCDR